MVDGKLEAVEQRMLELAIAISVEDRYREGRAHFHLGGAYLNLPDYQQAIKNYAQALPIFKDMLAGRRRDQPMEIWELRILV